MWGLGGQKLIYTQGNRTAVFTDAFPSPLWVDFGNFSPGSVAGVYDRQSVPGVDGAMLSAAQLSTRPIRIKGVIMGAEMGSQQYPAHRALIDKRAELSALFDPTKTGLLQYYSPAGAYRIRVTPNETPTYSNVTAQATCEFAVDCTADDPYWMDDAETTAIIGAAGDLLELPTELETVIGNTTAMGGTVHNGTGDIVYPVIRFAAQATAPELINLTTGKRLVLSGAVGTGRMVEVDTNPAALTVREYSVSGKKLTMISGDGYWLTPDSDLDFWLDPGNNDMVLANSAVSDVAPCTMLWRGRWMGL